MPPDCSSAAPPWQAGLQAARANLLPGLLVQGAMLALVLGYFFLPATRPAFHTLGLLKEKWGFLYSGLSAALAGGILPELLRVAVFQKGRVRRENFANLLFSIPFWGGQGVIVDHFYRWQAVWFGTEAHWLVILQKVCVDQFLYNPLFAAPFGVILYEWKNRRFRRSPDLLTPVFYRDRIFPALLATWAFWMPMVSIIYALPLTLQIPIFSLALTFWSLIFTWMYARRTA